MATLRNTQIGKVRAHVTREDPPVRAATFPGTGETATYGVPGFQAEFYEMPEEGPHQEHASTFDHVLGALTACLTGTLGKALSVRGIDPLEGRLESEGEGDIEIDEDGIMVMRRVRVRYRVVAPEELHEAARRAHTHHVSACGVARSLGPALDISTEMDLIAG